MSKNYMNLCGLALIITIGGILSGQCLFATQLPTSDAKTIAAYKGNTITLRANLGPDGAGYGSGNSCLESICPTQERHHN